MSKNNNKYTVKSANWSMTVSVNEEIFDDPHIEACTRCIENKIDFASIIRSQYEKQRTYITELEKNLYNKAKQHYEKKETYMVDAMKVREHTTKAVTLKNLSIITTENDIASANIENTTMALEVGMKIAMKL